jgi:HK97 family phage major capsid protein
MSTVTTNTAAYPWRPDETFFTAGDVVPQALILQTSTVAGSVDGDQPAVRVAYVDDAESAAYIAEASAITEDDPTLAEIVVRTKKISRLVNLSNEQYRQDQTAEQLAASVSRDLVRKADASYIDDTSPVGLQSVPGIVAGGHIGAAAGLDALIDLIAQLESNGAVPTHIVLDPLGWAELRKLKVGGVSTNESLLGAGVTDAALLVLGLPVLKSRFITPYHGLVVDSSAVVSAIGPVSIAVSEHSLFASDSVQLRATWRIGWGVTRPDRIGKFTTEPGS